MKSKSTKQFRALFAHLPQDVQLVAHRAYEQFRADPSYPGLDFKQVSRKGPTYSARVGIHYHALAVRKEAYWLRFWIGPHAEYDRLLQQIQ